MLSTTENIHSIFPLPSFLCAIQDSKNTVETGVERVKAEPMDAYKVSASSEQSRAAKAHELTALARACQDLCIPKSN